MSGSMATSLSFEHFDLVSPDGVITEILKRDGNQITALFEVKGISPHFKGFSLDSDQVHFNLKSAIAQVGIEAIPLEIEIDKETLSARAHIELFAVDPLGTSFLPLLSVGSYIGKFFAADPRRRVRNPDYLLRMFGRNDREGHPLLLLGGKLGSQDLELEKWEGWTVAHLTLRKGAVQYDDGIKLFLPTLERALHRPSINSRQLLSLHQSLQEDLPRVVEKGKLLLCRTLPLHIRTAFARVVNPLLPKGVTHTNANILQPDTKASGDIYELYGSSEAEVTHIPLEFFTLEPYREHVFFSDRDQLQKNLENQAEVFKAFKTAPSHTKCQAATFVVKGDQMAKLTPNDWISRDLHQEHFPGLFDLPRQSQMVQEYIEQQPSYPFLKEIERGHLSSQGVLFTRYFPSPLLKKSLLGDMVQSSLKGIYFETPSYSHGDFFSHEDRTLLIDLAKFAIPVFWADQTSGKILQYAPKPDKDTGMFVPIPLFNDFVNATTFGVYGSTLLHLEFEQELTQLMKGVLAMKQEGKSPYLNKNRPIALITGGGPGVMETGNRVARNLQILSCANIVDFSKSHTIEQHQNPYIDAKMTYRIDRLVERQGEFNLDFPIFMMGGFGTDFEFALEGVRRKVEVGDPTPILLLGKPEYWRGKITSCFQTNVQAGTIVGTEWVSNCFYCVRSASEGLKVYRDFFNGTLKIGRNAPSSKEGFITIG